MGISNILKNGIKNSAEYLLGATGKDMTALAANIAVNPNAQEEAIKAVNNLSFTKKAGAYFKGFREAVKNDIDEGFYGIGKRGNSAKGRAAGIVDEDGFKLRDVDNWDRLSYYLRDNKTGEMSWKRGGIAIAGGYMGVSAAGRVASGGGLYRDSDGNFDLMGIPFI